MVTRGFSRFERPKARELSQKSLDSISNKLDSQVEVSRGIGYFKRVIASTREMKGNPLQPNSLKLWMIVFWGVDRLKLALRA